jgi:broad specificity phosphatase PhoE
LRHLLLIKHSLPEIAKDSPAKDWPLSETGIKRCEILARAIAPYVPEVLISSRERKAQQTAELLAARLGGEFIIAEELHEQEREQAPFLSAVKFQEEIRLLFEKPAELILGSETADQAHHRFEKAIQQTLNNHPQKNIAIIAHGTVISLFVSRLTGLDPFSLWQRLGLPAVVVLSLPGLELVEIMERVE